MFCHHGFLSTGKHCLPVAPRCQIITIMIVCSHRLADFPSSMRSILNLLCLLIVCVIGADVIPVAPKIVSTSLIELTSENFDETITAHANFLVEV